MRTRLYILFSILLLDMPARAEHSKINALNLQIGFAGLVPAFLFQTFVHERTHAAIAKSQGAKIIELSFYPVRKNGEFYFGLTTAEWPKEPTDKQAAHFYISPAITSIIIFSATEATFALGGIDHSSCLSAVIFLVGELAPWIDFTHMILLSKDISRFEEKTGVPMPITRSVGIGISFFGGYLMLNRAKKIFWRHTKKTALRRIKLTPFSDIGASVTMEF